MSEVRNGLRRLRQARGWSQQELAQRAGVTRQTVSGVESGRYLPSVAVALRLARALGCSVEDLFALEAPPEELLARWSSRAPAGAAGGERPGLERVALAEVRGRWVAHPLSARTAMGFFPPADGVLTGSGARAGAPGGRQVAVRPLRPLDEIRRNVVIAGCDPALGLLAAWFAERSPAGRMVWLHASSRAALGALGAGEVHVAGLHLWDEASGAYNAPFVRRALRGGPALLVHLAQWEEGFIVAAGNPLGVRGAEDLADRRVRLVNREPGAGARELLDRLLREAGIPPQAVRGYEHEVAGHLAVAEAVAMGTADVGVGTRAAAEAFGLGFVPLRQERFDLALAADLAEDPRLAPLLDALASRGFRAQLGSVAGYDTRDTGLTETVAGEP
ncbi:MAG: helix-turn-helix domain-containing protein [Firmicutes bacterium]|nr:helix-turn-helix domain-containing protein [Bacillota bacterium]